MAQEPDIDKMQQEAVRRMQEMQARATKAVKGNSSDSQNTTKTRQSQAQKEKKTTKKTSSTTKKEEVLKDEPKAVSETEIDTEISEDEKPTDIFGELFKDKERNILLTLILLLSSEKADPSVIMALLYLL